MSNILDAAKTFEKLQEIQYEFVLAKKNKSITLNISFEKYQFHHLAGLQYLRDIESLNKDREKVFNEILSNKISVSEIEASDNFSKVSDRIHFLAELENIFDSNDTVFKYDPNLNILSSEVSGEFLMKNNLQNRNIFLFLDKKENETNQYFCKSFFPQNFKDFSYRQKQWTILSKKKIWKDKNIEIVLYDYFREKEKNIKLKNEIINEYENKRSNNVLIPIEEYEKLKETYKIVYEHCNITISGKKYECVEGLAKGFANAVGECKYLSQQIQSIKKTRISNNIETDFGKK